MSNLKHHLEAAADKGFNVESLETLAAQLRELTRLVGRGQYREGGNLAASMEARCLGLTGQCFRFADRAAARDKAKERAAS